MVVLVTADDIVSRSIVSGIKILNFPNMKNKKVADKKLEILRKGSIFFFCFFVVTLVKESFQINIHLRLKYFVILTGERNVRADYLEVSRNVKYLRMSKH